MSWYHKHLNLTLFFVFLIANGIVYWAVFKTSTNVGLYAVFILVAFILLLGTEILYLKQKNCSLFNLLWNLVPYVGFIIILTLDNRKEKKLPSAITDNKRYRQRWIALTFMGVALLVISLDNSVLNLALPSIAQSLGSTASQLQWIVDAYVVAIAGLLLTAGYLGDRLGRKPTLTVGLVLFALFSLGAALSNSTGMLIVMRALMGIAAATILPATLSILTATFREPKERAQAIAIWAAIFGLGMGIGPLVGGWLLIVITGARYFTSTYR